MFLIAIKTMSQLLQNLPPIFAEYLMLMLFFVWPEMSQPLKNDYYIYCNNKPRH